MSININLEPNLSLCDIKAQMEQGVSVMRSAHVGNARAYNLAIAELGIPMLLVDHNIVVQTPDQAGDKNYLPGSIVTRESIEPLELSTIGGLALKTEVQFNGTPKQHVDELHVASLKAAFPDTEIFTNTEYLRNNESVVGEIIPISLDLRPDLFKRIAEDDGTVRQNDGAAKLVQTYGVLQLNDDPRTERGVLVPNEVDILINFVIEALETERDTQIHLSGPDMQNYMKDENKQAILNTLYAAVRTRTSFGPKLPEEIDVKLVPTDNARFVTTEDRSPMLQQIFEVIRSKRKHATNKSTFFNSPESENKAARSNFLQESKQIEQELDQELCAVVHRFDELFVGPKEAPYLSQYDLLGENSIFMPEENTTLTMASLSKIMKMLQKFRENSK
jgi:hypothetical protein